jgi:hypothetical protein
VTTEGGFPYHDKTLAVAAEISKRLPNADFAAVRGPAQNVPGDIHCRRDFVRGIQQERRVAQDLKGRRQAERR